MLEDVRNGYVSAAAARDLYGVVVTGGGRRWQLDEDATAALRRQRSTHS